MGAMQNPEFKKSPWGHLDTYDEKTSEHGHYELANQYKNGSSSFNWVEDNRSFEAPPQADAPAEPEAAPAEPTPVKDSPEIQSAKERVTNYKSGVSQMKDSISNQLFSGSTNDSMPASNEDTEPSNADAAESFLANKRMKFSDTLNLA